MSSAFEHDDLARALELCVGLRPSCVGRVAAGGWADRAGAAVAGEIDGDFLAVLLYCVGDLSSLGSSAVVADADNAPRLRGVICASAEEGSAAVSGVSEIRAKSLLLFIPSCGFMLFFACDAKGAPV
jgi:hypothetical protein